MSKSFRYQNGVSLYLTLMIMSILLALALGTSAILVTRVKMMKWVSDSIVAFYAANTGIEKGLYAKKHEGASFGWTYTNYFDVDGIQATYKVEIKAKGSGDCPVTLNSYCMDSTGTYQGITRTLRYSY